ncbi:hypothetical protein [Pantoea sp. UBA5035]|uniref:hypothetical protein n=1 Tax=Pantoea sp. UBA5035 TaxID=1947035 RepID=UPI00257BDC10|nr:hypothetical protein [Pantoea sp. UBA5035]
MMQFTEEQREVLAGLCRIEIKRWKAASESNPNMRYMVELMEISLAALAAEPVAFLGEADGEFEYNGCRSFSFCPEKVTEFYSAPPVAALRLPVDGLPDVSEESYEYRTGFAMGCACYAKRVIELNGTAPAINLAELVPDENEIERIYSIYCTQTVGSKNALRHIRNELLRKIEEVK